MTSAAIEAQLRQYVLTAFLPETPAEDFANTDDLFQLLDSLQVLRLVMQLDTLFAVKTEDQDLTAENLGSIRKAAAFVRRKLSRADAVTAGPGGAATEPLSGPGSRAETTT